MKLLQLSSTAPSLVLLLTATFLQPVLALPQDFTTSDAIYFTDALGDVTFTELLPGAVAGATTTSRRGAVAVTAATATGTVLTNADGFPVEATATVTSVPPAITGTNTVGPAPPTIYSYTTTDADGDTIVVTETFTPTYQPTVYPTSYISATVLAYSDWTSLYLKPTGSGASSATAASGASSRLAFDGASSLLWTGAATIFGVVAGIRAVGLL